MHFTQSWKAEDISVVAEHPVKDVVKQVKSFNNALNCLVK